MAGNFVQFVNPYNFVPLSSRCNRGEYVKGNLTGVIEYSLLTKTPLFVPDTETVEVDENGHKTYQFFSYDGETPIISGSEMRGMLRSYYEIMTNSCLSAIDTDKPLYKRTNEVYTAGLIKKEKDIYTLYKATDCLLRTDKENSLKVEIKSDKGFAKSFMQSELLEGQKVYISCSTRDRGKPLVKSISTIERNENCNTEAYIIKGEPGPEMKEHQKDKEKHCCHVFKLEMNKNGNIRPEGSIDISKLLESITLYQNQNGGNERYMQYKKQLKKFIEGKLDNEYFPVYYSKISSDNILLSPASITREVYKTKISDMIGDYKACDGKHVDGICPTCRLFGMLNKKAALTSRIRVTDMKHVSDDNGVYDSVWTLKPMSTPKLQNIEFYMRKPDDRAWFWTYDYYIDDEGNIHINGNEYNAEINGRKFYWHHPQVTKSKVTQVEKKENNITIKPLKAGNKFEGKIYFNDITEEELNSLVYLLNTGEKEELGMSKHGYKLGHAKPFGFGSVAVSVDAVRVRKVKAQSGKIKLVEQDYEGDYDNIGMKDENFDKITEFNAIKSGNIQYPTLYGTNKDGSAEDGFKWFVGNHQAYDIKKGPIKSPNKRTQMVYKEYLKPMETKLLPVEEQMNKKIGNNSSYNKNKHNKGGNNFSSGKRW